MIHKYLKEIKTYGKTKPVTELIFYNSILKELDKNYVLYEDRHMIIYFIAAYITMNKSSLDYGMPEIHIERKEIPLKLIFTMHPNSTALSENIRFFCSDYNKKINKYLDRLKMFTELSK